jgi:glucose/mannose-6-phosphate isomerase
MLDQMTSFPSQLTSSLSVDIRRDVEAENVVVGGLGGSAMGGDVLAEYMAMNSSAPTFVVRDTTLPRWADERTLVILISYSGNTRETASMYASARERGCPMVIITSGGKLMDVAEREGLDVVKVPPGYQPRAALGHLLGSAACIVESVGLAPMASDIRAFLPSLETLMQDLLPSSPQARNAAKRIALRLLDTVPFVYAPRPMRSAATRWQTQINENSKMLCLSGEVPEMDHNQIVGWIDGARDGRNRPVMLLPRSGGYMALDLMRATIELFDDHDIDTVVADLEGASPLESALHGIMLGDFVSYYLAILRGVDPTPVPSIKELKGRLV